MRPIRLCQHCKRRQINRPRLLCWSCFYEPAIRQQYEAVRNQYMEPHNLNRDNNKKPRLPTYPTDALPGSAEKIAIMEARFAEGLAVFHPEDRSNRVTPAEMAGVTVDAN
jgi:hypothetical protein